MTARARITQDDIDRATRSIVRAGIDQARIILRLDSAEIEIIIGAPAAPDSPAPPANPWDSLRDR